MQDVTRAQKNLFLWIAVLTMAMIRLVGIIRESQEQKPIIWLWFGFLTVLVVFYLPPLSRTVSTRTRQIVLLVLAGLALGFTGIQAITQPESMTVFEWIWLGYGIVAVIIHNMPSKGGASQR